MPATVIAMMASLCVAQQTPADWRSFTSSKGFSVKYPRSWLPKGTSTDRLTLLSSKGGAEALVIRPGQGLISVMEDGDSLNTTLDQVVDRYLRDTFALSRRSLENENAGALGCRAMIEIVSREAAVPPEDVPSPPPFIINTEYFCQVGRHKYVTALRNFEGDERQASYQRVALQVAKTLRADR